MPKQRPIKETAFLSIRTMVEFRRYSLSLLLSSKRIL
jgi:hypothetical protein